MFLLLGLFFIGVHITDDVHIADMIHINMDHSIIVYSSNSVESFVGFNFVLSKLVFFVIIQYRVLSKH